MSNRNGAARTTSSVYMKTDGMPVASICIPARSAAQAQSKRRESEVFASAVSPHCQTLPQITYELVIQAKTDNLQHSVGVRRRFLAAAFSSHAAWAPGSTQWRHMMHPWTGLRRCFPYAFHIFKPDKTSTTVTVVDEAPPLKIARGARE